MKFPWVLFFDLGISNSKIVAQYFAEFPGVKNLFFSRISKGNVTNLKLPEGAFQKSIPNFNWSILALIIIIYSTFRKGRGFCAALFVKTQINVKCKVVYEAKENFVKNFWLTGKTDFSVFWYRHASKHRESNSVEVFVVHSTQIDQNEFF